MSDMKDIQGQRDYRRINIKKVGVKNISYPVTVLDKARKTQKTVATVNMYVNLPHQFKGTHMSRFVEILNRFHGEINLKSFHRILEEMKIKLQAEAAHLEITFPYFLQKSSAQSQSVGMKEYLCTMHGSLEKTDDLILEIQVPISPPLPAQSGQGLPRSLGHWGRATIRLRFKHFIWMEEIIQLVEEVTSPDLCWPTPETCMEYTLSVESITTALGRKLENHPAIAWFSILVENLSQGYNTFASLEWQDGNNMADA
jgi:GTP cyclohydrolase I